MRLSFLKGNKVVKPEDLIDGRKMTTADIRDVLVRFNQTKSELQQAIVAKNIADVHNLVLVCKDVAQAARESNSEERFGENVSEILPSIHKALEIAGAEI